jgi:3-isopropylmalate dehydratase
MHHGLTHNHRRTSTRKNFTSIGTFVEEPDSRAQCVTLEENVKEFGVTYFGMTDRRQGERLTQCAFLLKLTMGNVGIVHIIGPEQGFTVCRIHNSAGCL